jgi:hypothetical protein
MEEKSSVKPINKKRRSSVTTMEQMQAMQNRSPNDNANQDDAPIPYSTQPTRRRMSVSGAEVDANIVSFWFLQIS